MTLLFQATGVDTSASNLIVFFHLHFLPLLQLLPLCLLLPLLFLLVFILI